MVIIVMGVAGAGKTTLGRRLAGELGWPFHDADDLHDPASVDRMRRGEPLDDEQRGPWLATLADLIAHHVERRVPMVLACSALSRMHRAALLARVPDTSDVRLVHLHADPAVIGERLARRQDHFFAPSLLGSQVAALEVPGTDDGVPVLALEAGQPVDTLVAAVRDAFAI